MHIWHHWHLCFCLYACVWLELQNTFWAQKGCKINETFLYLIYKYLKEGSKLYIKIKYEYHV